MSDQVGPSSYLGNRTAGHPDHVKQGGCDDERISGQSEQPLQAGWMAHWTQSRSKSATQSLNHSMPPSMSKESEYDIVRLNQLEAATSISNSRKRGRDVTRAEEVEIMSRNLRINSENGNTDRVDYRHFGMRNLSLRKDNTFAIPKSETSSKGDRLMPENASYYCDFHLKSHKSFEKNISAVSRTFENHFTGSTSRTFPYGVQQEIFATESFACIQEGISRPSFHFALKEHLVNTNHHSNSAVLHHGKSDRSKLLDGPSTSKTQPLIPVVKKWEQLQVDYGVGPVPTQVSPPWPRTLDKLYLRCPAPSKIPYSPCDVETMNTSTTIGSVEKVSGGPSKISQTKRHFLISETADVDMSKKSQIFRESMLSTKVSEGCLKGTPCISPDHAHHDLTGVQLQPLGKTIDVESGDYPMHIKSSVVEVKNESSSKTDIMDMDSFQNHHLSGTTVPRSDKETKRPEITLFGKRTDGKLLKADLPDMNQLPETSLPDMNQELTAPFDVASPADGIENSISRTQSLDAEYLTTHAEHPLNSKSTACPDSILGQESGSRWVKRLKLISSESHTHGTNSSKKEDALPSEKVNSAFSKILRCSMTTPDPNISSIHGKEQRLLDRTTVSLKKIKSSSIDPLKKDQDVSLSHPWIRRWCSYQAASSQKKSELVMICAPHSSNTASNNVRNKQFPSIAAMALMGKAINGFQPCEFQKRGSYLIWDVDGF